MSKNQRHTARQPATKFAHLRKKIDQRKLDSAKAKKKP